MGSPTCGNNSLALICGVKRTDSSATVSKSANCFNRLPDVGSSSGRERYGDMSAVLEFRREGFLLEDAEVEFKEALDSAADSGGVDP